MDKIKLRLDFVNSAIALLDCMQNGKEEKKLVTNLYLSVIAIKKSMQLFESEAAIHALARISRRVRKIYIRVMSGKYIRNDIISKLLLVWKDYEILYGIK